MVEDYFRMNKEINIHKGSICLNTVGREGNEYMSLLSPQDLMGLSRAALLFGSILRTGLDPTRKCDAKSIEAGVQAAGFTTTWVNSCLAHHGLIDPPKK